MTPLSRYHDAAETIDSNLTASPASSAVVASPALCGDIVPDRYADEGSPVDDCLLQPFSLSGLVAFSKSTQSLSRSLGTRSSPISAVRSPYILISLSCAPRIAHTLDATPTPRSDLHAVAPLTVDVNLTASIARSRVMDVRGTHIESSCENRENSSEARARHAPSNQGLVIVDTPFSRKHRSLLPVSALGPVTTNATTVNLRSCLSPVSASGSLTGDAITAAVSDDVVPWNPVSCPRPAVRYS